MKVVATYPTKRPLQLQVFFWIIAGVLLVGVLYELFRFEEFPAFIQSNARRDIAYQPIAAIIVSIQVFALPYLLGMKTSLLMRYTSMLCAILGVLFLGYLVILAF